MIKFVLAALWICAATLGAVFYSFQTASTAEEEKVQTADTMMGGLDYVKTEVISVPLIRDAVVRGYFLSRLVYTVDPLELRKLSVPADALITDVVYSYVYSAPELDFTKHETLDLDAFRNGVRDRINAAVKQDLVKDVLVEQIDFLTRDEIRDNAIKRRQAGSKGFMDESPAKAEGEHAAPAH